MRWLIVVAFLLGGCGETNNGTTNQAAPNQQHFGPQVRPAAMANLSAGRRP